MEHGANVIQDECIEDFDDAIARHRIAYGMSDEQLEFVRTLYQRKRTHPPRRILLSDAEADWLRSQSGDVRASELCFELLHEIGIDVRDRP